MPEIALDRELDALDLTRRASRVRRVLDDELFLIVFQPIVDLRTGATAALEALSRFPAEPARPPQAWFSEAADVGLGIALEVAALRHALRYLGDIPPDARLAVNVSAQTAVSDQCRRTLETMEVDRLIVELDGFAGIDPMLVAERLAPLRARGLEVCLDELREGVVDIARFVVLRPDIVKLDGAVAGRVDCDDAARAIVKAALRIFQAGVLPDGRPPRVVAHHVERRAQLDTLALLGVDWGQGYYLGRPTHVRVPRAAVVR